MVKAHKVGEEKSRTPHLAEIYYITYITYTMTYYDHGVEQHESFSKG